MQLEMTIKNYRCFSDRKPARITLPTGFVAFVGANNSGKSSLLKFFYEFRSLFQALTSPTGTVIEALRGNSQTFTPAISISDIAEVFCDANTRDLTIHLRWPPSADTAQMSAPPHLEEVILTVPRDTNTWTAKLSLGIPTPSDINIVELNGTRLRVSFNGQNSEIELGNLYQTCKILSETLYIGPFRNAINIGTKQDYFDIKVGQSFIELWRDLKTGNIKSHSEAAYKLTHEIKSLFEFRDLEINSSADNQTLQIFINGKSYKLSELGSGLTQFILVLATAATKQPSYILIDEPELNLHPSLQLDFLTTLASYACEGILFGTHSIGLARAAADRIYSLRKPEEESEVIALEATPRLAEFLGELSFSGYRELGFDRVLLVEGPTDVKTVQQFLRLWKKDHQVVLLPIYGSNLIGASSETIEMQLEEIKRISENVAALIDSERPDAGVPLAPEREAFVETCRRAKIRCHVLERRAIQ